MFKKQIDFTQRLTNAILYVVISAILLAVFVAVLIHPFL
jgi:hypothetical protein